MKIKTQAALTAAAIKKELKSIGIKASCRSENFSGGNSVDVTIYDQSPENIKKAKALVSKYKYGHFDGMTDCYNSTNRRTDIPQAKYVHIQHEMSREFVETILSKINKHYNKSYTYS